LQGGGLTHGQTNIYSRFRDKLSLLRSLVLGEGHTIGTSKGDVQGKITHIDSNSTQFMKHAAKECRKLKLGCICFSRESVIWIKCEQIYNSLVEYNLGRNKTRRNLKRAARRQGITNPFQILMAELKTWLEECKEHNNYFRKNGPRYRKKFLLQRAKLAREDGQDKAAAKIMVIITRKQDRSFRRNINYKCGKTKGGSPTSVQISRGGHNNQSDEYTTQASVQEAIWANVHYKHLYLADEAPICQGQLRRNFGYNAATKTAVDILDGTYVFPDKFDNAT
jgi:hypothetical protein